MSTTTARLILVLVIAVPLAALAVFLVSLFKFRKTPKKDKERYDRRRKIAMISGVIAFWLISCLAMIGMMIGVAMMQA